MPVLHACGCNWCISSDDFVFSGLFALLIRTGWFVASAVILNSHLASPWAPDATTSSPPSVLPSVNATTPDVQPTPCQCDAHHDRATIFVCGLLADLFMQCVLQLVLIYKSGRGRMNDALRDEQVSKLIALQLFLFALEVCWSIVGTAWMYGSWSCCPTSNEIKGLNIFCYVWICLYLLHIVCKLDFAGCCRFLTVQSDPESAFDGIDGPYRATQRSWERCCRVLCCPADVGSANRGVILDVSRMFATAFHKTGISGNMVFTDLAASMALVQLRQEREEREHNRVNSIAAGDRPYAGKQGEWDHPCSPIDFDDPEQQTKTQAYADCCYYMKYALAAYGWPLLMLMHIGTGLCRMVPDCRCCACCRTHRTPDDDCLECNTSAVLYQTGLSRDDIIHITCHNKAYRPPFFVSVDRTKRAVVVSIRGTLSISDALTDVTAEAVSFEHTAGTLHAHRGIFKAAKYVKTQVEQHNSGESCILDRAFEYAKEVDPNGDYKLVVVGHSLGGGTASILSLLFVLERSYPGLLCFAYSPPGGLLSLPAVEITKEFTTSVVLGKDLIPRLSLEKTYQLLNNMMAETQRTLSPKWLIQLKCFCACCCRCQSCQRDETIEREKESEAPHGDNANGTGYCMAEGRLACPPLYTPGNIIYITAFPEDKKSYRAYWTDYKEFHTVFVGAAMVGDHLAHNVYDALQALNPDKDV